MVNLWSRNLWYPCEERKVKKNDYDFVQPKFEFSTNYEFIIMYMNIDYSNGYFKDQI